MRNKPKDKYIIRIERVLPDNKERHDYMTMSYPHSNPLQEVTLNSVEVIEVMALIARMRGER
jgi:hypothetical protein